MAQNHVRLATFAPGASTPFQLAIHPKQDVLAMLKLLPFCDYQHATELQERVRQMDVNLLARFVPATTSDDDKHRFLNENDGVIALFYGDHIAVRDQIQLACHLCEVFRSKTRKRSGDLPTELWHITRHQRHSYVASWFYDAMHTYPNVSQQSKAVLFAFCCKIFASRLDYSVSDAPDPVAHSPRRKDWKLFDLAMQAYGAVVEFHAYLSTHYVMHTTRGYKSQGYSTNDAEYVMTHKPQTAVNALCTWADGRIQHRAVCSLLGNKKFLFVGQFLLCMFEKEMSQATLFSDWKTLTFSRPAVSLPPPPDPPAITNGGGEEEPIVINHSKARYEFERLVKLKRLRDEKRAKREAQQKRLRQLYDNVLEAD